METTMTMLFIPGPRPFHPATILPSRRSRYRASGWTAGELAAAMIEAPRRLVEVYVHRLLRRRMKRALYAMSDRLLADIGICRSEIDAAVNELIPHRRWAR
jgi:uncharacterized protein YjiS (DUF1127 family)